MGRVSVVIPTLDEAERIASLVATLRGEPELAEIIVADGGSADGTPAIAEALGARVIQSAQGRGRQLGAGAAAASGEILLFLHADSVFPAGGLAALAAALDGDPRTPGGNFRVVFDGDSGFARWLTGFYAWLRRFALYYGDSGIFVRRAVYEAIGGFAPMPLMEDYDFVRRLERAGRTIRVECPPLVTSSRKFVGRRPMAIFWGWTVVHILYWLGVAPERLARLYYPRGWRRQAQRNPRHQRFFHPPLVMENSHSAPRAQAGLGWRTKRSRRAGHRCARRKQAPIPRCRSAMPPSIF